MVTITKDTIIGDILDMAPQTAPIFLSIGMHCLAAPAAGARLWPRPAPFTAWMWRSCWRPSTPRRTSKRHQ